MIKGTVAELFTVDRKSSASQGEPRMPKRATVVIEEQDMKTSTLAAGDAMARRKILAGHIRDRMAKPATEVEQKLWQELKAGVEGDRLTFRS
jgi:hypothetical protein